MKQAILILGGSAGLGEAVAKELSADYAKNVIIVGRNEEKMQKIAIFNKKIVYFKADITKSKDIDALIEFIKQKYILTDVVNSATVQNLSLIKDVSTKKFNESVNVNIKAPMEIISKIVKNNLLKLNGRILFISSTSRYNIQNGMGLYAITKAGAFALSCVLKRELNGKYLVGSAYPGTLFGTKTAQSMADSKIPDILNLRKNMKNFLHNNKQIRILSPEQASTFICWVLLKTSDQAFVNPAILLNDNKNQALSLDEWDIRDCKLYEGCPIECGALLRDLSNFLGE